MASSEAGSVLFSIINHPQAKARSLARTEKDEAESLVLSLLPHESAVSVAENTRLSLCKSRIEKISKYRI